MTIRGPNRRSEPTWLFIIFSGVAPDSVKTEGAAHYRRFHGLGTEEDVLREFQRLFYSATEETTLFSIRCDHPTEDSLSAALHPTSNCR